MGVCHSRTIHMAQRQRVRHSAARDERREMKTESHARESAATRWLQRHATDAARDECSRGETASERPDSVAPERLDGADELFERYMSIRCQPCIQCPSRPVL